MYDILYIHVYSRYNLTFALKIMYSTALMLLCYRFLQTCVILNFVYWLMLRV